VARDGTVVVVVFSDNWLPGGHVRTVTIDVTRPGQPTRHAAFSTPELGSFSVDRADVQISSNRFEGDLAHYSVTVDPKALQGLGCALQLERRVPSYRPGTGVMASGEDYFAWVVPVPEGALSGTLTVDGAAVPFSGSGYHDHNWGNAPPWALMRNWWWGRGEVDGHTVVMSEMRPAAGRGEKALALIYVASPQGVQVEAHGAAARLVEGPNAPNDDLSHVELRPAQVTLEAEGGASSKFLRHGAPLTSADLLTGSPGFTRFLARLTDRTPWYTRWKSTVVLEDHGQSTRGEGTIEFMDFE